MSKVSIDPVSKDPSTPTGGCDRRERSDDEPSGTWDVTLSTPRAPTLPNFLVIGAMKAGTTSLYQYLRGHPDVFMATPKELHFFSTRRGIDLDWYADHFSGAGTAIAIGEASASYTTYPDADGVPARIARVIPDARLIYVVRDPIERMRSHYLQRHGGGDERASIDQALLSEPIYLETSQYAKQIERYLDHFPLHQILIVKSEALREDRRATIRTVFEFIDVDGSYWDPSVMDREFYRTSDKQVPRRSVQAIRRVPWARRLLHRTPESARKVGKRFTSEAPPSDRAQVSNELRAQLIEILREDTERLRNYVAADFDGWGIA